MARGATDWDPRTLSDKDLEMGGFFPTPDDPATVPGLHVKRLAGNVRDKITMGQMKARMAALWRHGVLYADILTTVNNEFGLTGTEHEISVNTVKYHVQEMIGYWREMGLLHIDERQAMVLYRYDQLEQIATEAYFASCGGKRVRNYEKQIERAASRGRKDQIRDQVLEDRDNQKKKTLFGEGELSNTLEATAEKIKHYIRVEENPAGDPRFLAIMIDINHKRAQLWGLLAKGDQSTSDQELARLTDEDRTERIASVIAQARQRATGDMGMLVPASPLNGFEEGKEPTAEERGVPPEMVEAFVRYDMPQAVEEITLDDLEWE